MAEARLEGPPLRWVRPSKMCPSGGMVDALDSKSCSERSARSSRAWGTILGDAGHFQMFPLSVINDAVAAPTRRDSIKAVLIP